LAKLRFDFFESANGETIIVEFPDGGVGIVDAHPSAEKTRPQILDLVGKRKVHFVCLTHPHADHGVDLIPILRNHGAVHEFWHTNSDISSFVYHCLTERPNYPSPVREFVNRLADGWADFLLDLYSSVRELPERKLHSNVQPIEIAGVRIWILGPEEQQAKQFVETYLKRASGVGKLLPSPNLLSAILGIEYGGCLAVLGSDALKAGWNHALEVHKAHGLPRAVVLKVPHHGAANALALEKGRKNYFDLCSKQRAVGILFAGDSKHPNKKVFDELRTKTLLLCLSNGQKGAQGPANPLNIKMPGARSVRRSYVCQPQITVELSSDGSFKVDGIHCEECLARSVC